MKGSRWLMSCAILLLAPGLAQAQHGGHGAGHAGGMAPAHFYGGSGGMHAAPPHMHVAPPPMHVAPPPMHVAPPPMHVAPPPMHMPISPPMHLPSAAPMQVPHSAAAHLPATHQPVAGLVGANVPAVHAPGTGGSAAGATSSNPAAPLEAARLAALEARYLSAPWCMDTQAIMATTA